MSHPLARRTGAALATAVLMFGAAACSSADEDGDAETFSDDGNVPAETVQASFEEQLTAEGYTDTTDISCEGVADEVDATTTCSVSIAGEAFEVPVTVAESTETTTTFEFDTAGLPVAE